MASAAVKKPMFSNHAGISSAKGKNGNPILKRKIETSNKKQSVDTKSKSIPPKLAISQKDKGKAIAPRTPVKKVMRQKKVYNLPGQKHDPPEEREPVRLFYESLSKQIPMSEMAEFWLMEHGILSPEKARKAYEKKQRKQKQNRMGTPIKAPPSRALSGKPESSNRQKLTSKNVDTKIKRKIAEEDDDEVIPTPKRRKV